LWLGFRGAATLTFFHRAFHSQYALPFNLKVTVKFNLRSMIRLLRVPFCWFTQLGYGHFLFPWIIAAGGTDSVIDCTDTLRKFDFVEGAAMLSATVSNES
jgi:hypothetical protein